MLLKSDIYLNNSTEKVEVHFRLNGNSMTITMPILDYKISQVKPVQAKGLWVYQNKVFLKNPLSEKNKTIDEVINNYDLFVDRKEDILDNEPKSWEEYIGQEEYKESIQETIKAVRQDGTMPYPHVLISGQPGYGKSALIHLLASEGNFPLIETVAGNIQNPEDIYALLAKLSKTPPYSILFIDEIHGIKKEIAELLLPAIQMFKVSNKPIPYFTFAGATTDLGLLTSKLAPLVDRCSQKIVLNPYTNKELSTIVKNICQRKNIQINDEALLEIADRSRETPRLAISNLFNIWYYCMAKGTKYITKSVILQKLERIGVYANGITKQDLELLQYLAGQNKPVGQSTLVQKLNTNNETYLYSIEPFLVRRDYITRTARGRIITSKGKEYLENKGDAHETKPI